MRSPGWRRAGVTRVIGIPMAPQFSTLSVKKYIDAALAALPAGVQFDAVESFHTHPLLIDAFAERVRAAQPRPDELVIFTAHALPVRVIDAGDPYADEVAADGSRQWRSAPASRATGYAQAFQSAGRTPEPWLGPELPQVIDDRSATVRKFLVVPIGFVCDHTEILFDIDVQAARTLAPRVRARRSAGPSRSTPRRRSSPCSRTSSASGCECHDDQRRTR